MAVKIRSSEITPEHIYINRRKFMVGAGMVAAGATVAACVPSTTGGSVNASSSNSSSPSTDTLQSELADVPAALSHAEPFASAETDELGDPLNTFEQITNYNNYYEFSLQKESVAPLSEDFSTYPWTVEVGGLVNNPKTYGIEDLLTRFVQEERIYRLRCVEAWSMVIPWVGFSLASLLQEVDPKSEAKFVRFESVLRPEEMPGQGRGSFIDWPYVEGLRVDEAMNELTILSTGLYGKLLPNANGAPIRLIVPWKYGFKSIKGIVKIELTDTMPTSTWMDQASNEYGFYANVNPEVNHPRWSQATERRISGGFGGNRRETLKFNGYGEEVASLYDGMDLRANF